MSESNYFAERVLAVLIPRILMILTTLRGCTLCPPSAEAPPERPPSMSYIHTLVALQDAHATPFSV